MNYLIFPVASDIFASVTSTLNSCLGSLEPLMHSTADLSKLKESLALAPAANHGAVVHVILLRDFVHALEALDFSSSSAIECKHEEAKPCSNSMML